MENEQIVFLLKKLEEISQRNNSIENEIENLRNEIKAFHQSPDENIQLSPSIQTDISSNISKNNSSPTPEPSIIQKVSNDINEKVQNGIKTNWEKFIGENLINKIGILITIIGVGIGTKYSIEHDLISPVTRIVLGYLLGLGLMGFGIKLKSNYENFSAVLVSGAIAILYFITFAGYNYYNLFPQILAFGMMVIFTIFGIIAALNYNKQIIALIGLVGAYCVPFLLSNGSGRVDILFSYVAIINIGILYLSFKKDWKILYYSAFVITWLIVALWFFDSYKPEIHFTLALIFSTIFNAIFYIIFMAYTLKKQESFDIFDIGILLSNSFIYFGLGYIILNSKPETQQFLGLFTIMNGIIHFGVSKLIERQAGVNRKIFYLILGLVLVFLTLAIPVQLNGNWVTLLWTGEAFALYWLGLKKEIIIYEKLSYILMGLAFFSLVQDWTEGNSFTNLAKSTPFFNIGFLSSLIFCGVFLYINILRNKYPTREESLTEIISIALPGVLLIATFFTFRIEISNYFNQIYLSSKLVLPNRNEFENVIYNADLKNYKDIWLMCYTLIFGAVLTFTNISKIKNNLLAIFSLVLSIFFLFSFFTSGLSILNHLKENFILPKSLPYFNPSPFNIGIRYISYLFVGVSIFGIFRNLKSGLINLPNLNIQVLFDIIFHGSILIILTTEAIVWFSILKFSKSTQLSVSILLGLYALLLISLGIIKKRKHLRIGAIVLFGATLVKLFFYDIAHMGTITKTIVFVSLGILLLIISFMYNKFKHLIFDEDEK